jgi:L-threonylcarbamoyladenylate synthase
VLTNVATRIVAADAAAVENAARILRSGGLIAFPTETVYGLGADATNGEAVARLYGAKGRPSFNPLIVHVPELAAARRLARFDTTAERLAEAHWPGPLTLVLPAEKSHVTALATAGLDTVAVRVPAHPVAQALLRAFGGPIVAPSANRSGHVSPTTAAHVESDLGERVELILDGGATQVGLESTIIACINGTASLLRPGGISRDAIERVLGSPLQEPTPVRENVPIAPGQLASHYAPQAALRLDAQDVRPGEALLAFGHDLPPGASDAAMVRNLSARGDLIEAAANLFAYLRALDAAGAATIAVMPISPHGLGEAINDRLRRAAAPRNPS